MSEFDTPIIHKTFIKAKREKVFNAITTSEGLDGWFTRGTSVDLKPGGIMHLKWVNWGVDKITTEAVCPIIDVIIPEKFSFKWWEDHYTTVEIFFEEVEGGTIVMLKETGYQDTKEGRRRCLECAVGWGEALTLLKFFVEYNIRY
ncbi:SRPBCC family protein [Candidatus Hodarchaeum mangrovi]